MKTKFKRYDVEADCSVVPMNGSMYAREDGEYLEIDEVAEWLKNQLNGVVRSDYKDACHRMLRMMGRERIL